ncbi:MAG: ABC transporter substrate-binding protein [Lachnospiraceae bacterium]
MKKKVLSVLLTAALTAGLLAGCSGSGAATSETASGSETSESSEAVVEDTSATTEVVAKDGEDPQLEKSIKILSIWDKENDNGILITKLVDQYIAEVNPNFSYEYEFVSADDLRTKIATLAASNDLPDIFAYESGTPLLDYIDTDQVVNISDVVEEYDCADSLNSSAVSLLQTLTNTDDIYDLPLGLNVEGFWYNKAAFETAGIDKAPETWEEFEAACQKLQDAGIQPIAAGGADKWGVTRLINAYLVRTAGPEAMRNAADGTTMYTDEAYVAAAAKIQEWADKGWFGEGVNTVDMNTAGSMLMNDQAGIFYNGSWFASNLNDETANTAGPDGIGFFNVPVYDESISDSLQYSMNCGNILAVSSAKYDEATGWFIKYFVENMGNMAMETQGTVKGYNYDATSDSVTGYTQLVLDNIDMATSAFTWFEATMNSETSSVAQDNVQALLTGDLTPEDYMQMIQDAHDLSQ